MSKRNVSGGSGNEWELYMTAKNMKRVQNIIPLSHIRYHGVDGTSGKRQSFMAFPNRSTTCSNLSEVGTNLEFHVDISISFIHSFSSSHSCSLSFFDIGVTFLSLSHTPWYFICNQGVCCRIQEYEHGSNEVNG